MIAREVSQRNDVLVVTLSGSLVKEDYDEFNKWTDEILAEHKTMRLLCILHDFHGWGEMSAMWEDTKYGLKHRKDIVKFAMVGDQKWEEWLAKAAKPFMAGEVMYFDESNKQDAVEWIMR